MRFKILSLLAALVLVTACATEPEETGGKASGKGAAAAVEAKSAPAVAAPATGQVPGSKEDFIVNIGDRVFFDFDKSDLKPDAIATLNKQAAWLLKYPRVTITIEGHADERGTREYNLALGSRRANSVKEYLVSRGVATDRIEVISYGKERPAVLGSNEWAWAQNRRAVTVIKGGAAS
jgi:peptidoglycan-associated lipoprotein